MTYNIHGGVGRDGVRDYRRIGHLLAELNVDVALIQEMDTRCNASHPNAVADICADQYYTMAASPAINDGECWYGNAILSRFPISVSKSINTSQKGFEPRNIQEAILYTDKGPLRIINTHKGLRRRERRKQFELLDQHVHDSFLDLTSTLVVGGDFNEWQLFSKAFRHLDDLLTPHPVGPTFPTVYPVLRLDRLWTANSPAVKNARVVKNKQTRMFSDHFPIMIELDVK